MQETRFSEAEFAQVTRGITYRPARTSFISTMTGAPAHKEAATAEHWIQQAQQPARVEQGFQTLGQRGITAFVEIGPQSTLVEMGRRILPDDDRLWLPALHPQQEWRQLLITLGDLYRHGVEIDWQGFDQDYPRQWADLPTYPFQRQTYRLPIMPGTVRRVNGQSLDGHNHAGETTAAPTPISTTPYVAPQTATEQQLAAMWADLLGLERVGRHDQFFALGGNSVMVTQAVSAMRAAFGIELPLEALFEQPTVAAVAELVDMQLWATQGIDQDEEGVFEL